VNITEIIKMFEEGNKKIIAEEIDRINKSNPDEIISLLENVFSSVRESVKPQVCAAFALIITDQSYNSVKNLLKNRSWHVRNAAAQSIAAIKGKNAIPDLEPLLNDKAYGVREDVSSLIETLK